VALFAVGQRTPHAPLLRHVAKVHRQSVQGGKRLHLQPDPEGLVRRFELDPLEGRQCSLVLAVKRRFHRLRELFPQHASEQLLARAPQQALGLAVDVAKAPLAIHREEGVADALQRGDEAFAGFARALVHLLRFGHVLDGAAHPHHLGAGAALGLADQADPDRPLPMRVDQCFQVERGAVADAAADRLLHVRTVAHIDGLEQLRQRAGPARLRVEAVHGQGLA
jgi:hypothetical protein